jgi:hypothetical protein
MLSSGVTISSQDLAMELCCDFQTDLSGFPEKLSKWHLDSRCEGEDMRKLLSSVLWPIPALLFAPMILLFALGIRVQKKERP